jgi:hypothetical protein
VDFKIRGAFLARSINVLGRDALSALLHFGGDRQQRFQLVGDSGVLEVPLDCPDQLLVAVEMMRGDRAVDRLAIDAIVPRRDMSADQLASPGDKVGGPRNKTSTSSFIGFAVSGRNIMGPRIPRTPSGSAICGIVMSSYAIAAAFPAGLI